MFDVVLTFLLLSAASGFAATRYVDVNSAIPTPPYTSWATAARVIQGAVDAAAPGDTVLVTNGVYATGGRPVGNVSNRVAIEKPIRVESVNGPAVTIIKGARAPAGDDRGNGNGAVRCVYLGLTNAVLSGFTLTNGHTRTNGDWGMDRSGGGVLGGISGQIGGVLTNCLITGNSAQYHGGGAYGVRLYNCTVTGNSADEAGGGASSSTLHNCTVTGNSATYYYGGGAYGSTLNNCTLTGNSAHYGGGAVASTLNNCIVYFNRAPQEANYGANCTFTSSCTMPLPAEGTGNISQDPQLASLSHLSSSSPCIGAGKAEHARGTDIDGEPWANPPSTGCDEYRAGTVTGPLTVATVASYTNVATGFIVEFRAQIGGRVSASRWEFGDGTVVSNQPYATHSWVSAGDYPVVLRAYNESYPNGVSATVTVQVVPQAVHFVAANSANRVPPYTSWATAATTIQDAVDAATVAGALVLVANGTYATGGRPVGTSLLSNRVAIEKPIRLESVNGPAVTIIEGAPATVGDEHGNGTGAVRCVYLSLTNAVLSGFTLTNGHTHTNGDSEKDQGGGGVFGDPNGQMGGVLTNCVITGNSAGYSGGGVSGCTVQNCTLTGNSAIEHGGGAYASTLNNCTLIGNGTKSGYFPSGGGGAFESILNNCTLTGNSAQHGGGASSSTLYNCTLTGNSAQYGGGASSSTLYNCTLTGNSGGGSYRSTHYNCTLTGNYGRGAFSGSLHNCIVYFNRGGNYGSNDSPGGGIYLYYSCTTPLPPDGVGNISADPQLVTATHLSMASPCRGAGSALFSSGVDIDGEPWANPPSMGADETVSANASGPLSLWINARYTNFAAAYPADFVAQNFGSITQSVWDFGDGTLLTNKAFASHAWSTPGTYTVKLTGYNDSHPAGVSTTIFVEVIGAVHYVNGANPTPSPPFTTWETAATNIQAAIDAGTTIGRLVLVTNGIYQTGMVQATGSNRVVVTSTVAVRSVNGPEFTVIDGGGMMPCAYVGNDAVLSGFTLTNGLASEDWPQNDGHGGGVHSDFDGVATNCLIIGNSGGYGGGASGGTLYNCTLTGNSAGLEGGGVWRSTLFNCTITGNSAYVGGGADGGTLHNCTLTGNAANYGGGAVFSTLVNCTLTGNSAQKDGGGAASSTLYNCTLTGNSASTGGGASYGTLNNCTLTGNSAQEGGGAYGGNFYNCIVYFNSATNGANYFTGVNEGAEVVTLLNYSCTTPMPTNGVGNITADPMFVDAANGDFRLRPDSPCIDTGTNLISIITTDITGLPRPMDGNYDGVARFDMGAYEFNPYRFEPSLNLTADGFQFTIRGEPGKSVRIERSRDLVNWEFAGAIPIPASGQTLIDPAATTETQLFYRAARVP